VTSQFPPTRAMCLRRLGHNCFSTCLQTPAVVVAMLPLKQKACQIKMEAITVLVLPDPFAALSATRQSLSCKSRKTFRCQSYNSSPSTCFANPDGVWISAKISSGVRFGGFVVLPTIDLFLFCVANTWGGLRIFYGDWGGGGGVVVSPALDLRGTRLRIGTWRVRFGSVARSGSLGLAVSDFGASSNVAQ